MLKLKNLTDDHILTTRTLVSQWFTQHNQKRHRNIGGDNKQFAYQLSIRKA